MYSVNQIYKKYIKTSNEPIPFDKFITNEKALFELETKKCPDANNEEFIKFLNNKYNQLLTKNQKSMEKQKIYNQEGGKKNKLKEFYLKNKKTINIGLGIAGGLLLLGLIMKYKGSHSSGYEYDYGYDYDYDYDGDVSYEYELE